MYLIKTPQFIQSLFPNFVWKIPTSEKKMYLTFDDGPIPEVTPWVLETLKEYNAKATFFCVGDNVLKHPEVFQQVLDEGHTVGNHTFNHLNGWSSENLPYFLNTRRCAELVKSDLFRPPYGRVKRGQAMFLQRHYKVVMWDILSGDFDKKITPKQCADNVIKNAKEGSIVVFHDSLKAEENLKYALREVLNHFSNLGYSFQTLSPDAFTQEYGETA